MKLKEIFGFFIPEDRKFFPLFSDAADSLVLSSELLIKLVREQNLDKRVDYLRQIDQAEQASDDITTALLKELDGTLITPFDREDIHELINKMEDIVDYIYSTSSKINLYKLSEIPDDFVRIADRIHSANKEIQFVLRSVRKANDFKKHVQCNENIRGFESQVDDIYQEYLSNLFDQEVNAIELIKKRDILMTMVKAIETCEDVGNIFAALIIKMG